MKTFSMFIAEETHPIHAVLAKHGYTMKKGILDDSVKPMTPDIEKEINAAGHRVHYNAKKNVMEIASYADIEKKEAAAANRKANKPASGWGSKSAAETVAKGPGSAAAKYSFKK